MRKYDKVCRFGNWHPGPVTTKAVLSQLPPEVWTECKGETIAKIANAINDAYQTGKLEALDEI